MSPRLEREAAMDEVSDYAIKHQQARFSPIGTSIPDPRPPVRHVPSFALTHSAIGHPFTDADSSTVLDALVEAGELDNERIDLMLRLAASKRLSEQRVVPTPNGKWAGIAVDACVALAEIVTTLRAHEDFDTFFEVDVDKWAAICARLGMKL